jgi:hypothetical protein
MGAKGSIDEFTRLAIGAINKPAKKAAQVISRTTPPVSRRGPTVQVRGQSRPVPGYRPNIVEDVPLRRPQAPTGAFTTRVLPDLGTGQRVVSGRRPTASAGGADPFRWDASRPAGAAGPFRRTASRPADDAAVRGADMLDEAAKTGRVRSFWDGRPKWQKRTAKYGGLALGAGIGIGALGGNDPVEEEELYPELFPGEAPAPPSATTVFDDWLEEVGGYEAGTAPGYGEQAAQQAAEAQANLEQWLGQYSAYGNNQAAAIQGEYNDVAARTEQLAAEIANEGQMTAADIDALYGSLGGYVGDLESGAGLSADTGDTTGMVAAAGELATAGDMSGAYGASIADWLGRESSIDSSGMRAQALSTNAQGVAGAQGIRDEVTMQAAAQRFALQQQLLNLISEAERADRTWAAQSQQDSRQWDLSVADRRAQASGTDAGSDYEDKLMRHEAGIIAQVAWRDKVVNAEKDDPTRIRLEAAFGVGIQGEKTFRDAVQQNPQVLVYLGLAS